MNRPEGPSPRTRGFTLIEVLVAFSILSLTLAMLFSLLSAGARSTQISDEYNRAAVWAESKLAELGVTESLQSGFSQGRFDATYQWKLVVEKQQSLDQTRHQDRDWELLALSLRVSWLSLGEERELALSTVRLVGQE